MKVSEGLRKKEVITMTSDHVRFWAGAILKRCWKPPNIRGEASPEAQIHYNFDQMLINFTLVQ